MGLKRLADTWNHFGRSNPFWAVLTSSETWEPEVFFETGRQEISALMDHLHILGIQLQKGKALDFGCGVGRLSQALAGHFEEVHGVDIAASMVQAANAYNRYGAKCRYHTNVSDNLRIFPDGYFDLIYSSIVLQHMPPRLTRRYLAEFMRVLAPAGLLVFHLPSVQAAKNPLRKLLLRILPEALWASYRSTKQAIIAQLRHTPRMEMHGIERDKIIVFLSAHGGTVLDSRHVTWLHSPPGWEDYLYTATRT